VVYFAGCLAGSSYYSYFFSIFYLFFFFYLRIKKNSFLKDSFLKTFSSLCVETIHFYG